MKKIITGMVIVITFAFVNNTFAQDSKYNWLAQDSWSSTLCEYKFELG